MPELVHDLPAGAPRIKQHSQGIKATVVNGQERNVYTNRQDDGVIEISIDQSARYATRS